MPAIVNSKFLHAQRLLRRWRNIDGSPLLNRSQKKILRQDIIEESCRYGFGPKEFGRWLNKAELLWHRVLEL